MKAKLIKNDKDSYSLLYNYTNAGSVKEYGTIGKLSLKNCQAVEYGYDLDELAKNHIKEKYGIGLDTDDEEDIAFSSFQEGFQKALSILSDKKYTEDNMMQMAGYMSGIYKIPNIDGKEEAEKYLKTFEVQEWDVEIEVSKTPDGIFRENDVPYSSPKLDTNNCIILRKVAL